MTKQAKRRFTQLNANYASTETPPDYKCDRCGAHGCKLWRESYTSLNEQTLLCAKCAAKKEGADISTMDDHGRRNHKYGGRTCTIGCHVPAIPCKEGNSFWRFTLAPQTACNWWYRLPTLPKANAA